MSELSALQQQKAALESEHASLVEAIHELRARARRRSLEASSTRQPLPESEIKFWQAGIKEHQEKLMAVQSELGSVNKAIRAASPARQLKTLGQLPQEPKPVRKVEAAPINKEQVNSADLFLACFHQIVRDSIDPRQFAAFETGAKALQDDYLRMHGGRDA
jgi:hypothetical protein